METSGSDSIFVGQDCTCREFESDPEATFSDNAVMNKAVSDAVKGALELHRRAGNKVAVLRNGKVVKIHPKKIAA